MECLFKRVALARQNTKYIRFPMTYNWILEINGVKEYFHA